MSVQGLVHSDGYAAVFVLVMLESLGVPLPGETVLIAAGTYAGSTHRLSVLLVFAAAAAGAVLGDNIGFLVGRTGGYRLLRRYGPKLHIDQAKIKVGRLVFDRHGGKVVFFGRFVSVLRTYAAFLAGTNKLAWRRFLFFNAAGGLVWSAVYSFASYAAGHAITRASHAVDIVFGALAVVAVVAAILVVRRKASKLIDEAEVAYPGPLPER